MRQNEDLDEEDGMKMNDEKMTMLRDGKKGKVSESVVHAACESKSSPALIAIVEETYCCAGRYGVAWLGVGGWSNAVWKTARCC